MFTISNIKISCVFKISCNWIEQLKNITYRRGIPLKITANIYVVKDQYVMCFFAKKDGSVHINVTKIKNYQEIFHFLFFFSKNYFIGDSKLLSLKVDNITASSYCEKSDIFYNILKSNLNYKYNPERFPGIFIKFTKGSCIIFKNGKINILGCKVVADIEKIWKVIQVYH